MNRVIKTQSRLDLVRGEIEEVEVNDSAQCFSVKITPNDGSPMPPYGPSVIVCCLGANVDYAETGNPLWKRLIQRRLVQVHDKTGRGISVDESGAVVRGDGSVSERVFAVGPMRQGDEIERYGRLGAFVFSIGTIRNQALLAAVRLLWLSENPVYAKMDNFARLKIDAVCEETFSDPQNAANARRLVDAILAVRLFDIGSYLHTGDESALRAIRAWLQSHLRDTLERDPPPSG